MNIVQLNQYIEKIARCIQIVHSYSSQSPYEYWNAKGDIQYGSVCFCIKKSRMRSNTITYDAVLYYGDRVVDTPSNKEQIWSDANNVIQNIVGTINMQSDGEVTVSYPYDITNFEQKFADNLAGAYATLSIDTKGIGECGDLLYGYEEEEDKIKLESIVKTITVNGEYNITSSKDYDAISDVKVIVNVAPGIKDTFATIGYNDVTAGNFLNQFSADLEVSKRILDEWNTLTSDINFTMAYNEDIVYMPAVDFRLVQRLLSRFFDSCKNLRYIPSIDLTNRTSILGLCDGCESLEKLEKFENVEGCNDISQLFSGCASLTISPELRMPARKMSLVYSGCSKLQQLPYINLSEVEEIDSFCGGCESLKSVDLSGWNTPNLKKCHSMFRYCKDLQSVNLSGWNTSNVRDISYLFYSDEKLVDVDLSGWDLGNVTNIGYMFGYFGNVYTLLHFKFGNNLKTKWKSYGSPRYLPNLTVESLLSIIGGLYDFTGNGETPSSSQGQIEFGTTNLNKLTDEQKAVAINKGWTLT